MTLRASLTNKLIRTCQRKAIWNPLRLKVCGKKPHTINCMRLDCKGLKDKVLAAAAALPLIIVISSIRQAQGGKGKT
ncbi:uncharacterized protein BDW43DRAFT_281754 [Aspergillus alliaceus]|uniref:uncharacterized protein n=1 Tax=Petromyces alliaceus TaxID=209559 RepID=UPI0012A69E04|nr:uncharacterized protein BDW43DRAFT_281754 [Aspergillus alliaceus]KAB8231829.1 hypothetical protein BDW43DRAFT_281754 [Aspergillus alliaceus]